MSFKCVYCDKTYKYEGTMLNHMKECALTCRFCDKKYKREISFQKHTCKYKERYAERETTGGRTALMLFNQWTQQAYVHTADSTYMTFIKRPEYELFMSLAIFVKEQAASFQIGHQGPAYLKWLVDNNIKGANWTKPSIYEKFAIYFMNKEDVHDAFIRYVLYARTWAEEQEGREWYNYWDEATDFRVANDISMGLISPWIWAGLNIAKNRVKTLHEELLDQISKTTKISYWKRKIELNKPSIKWMNETHDGYRH